MAKEYIDREEIVKILNRHSYIANEPPMDKCDDAIVKELYSIKEEIKNTASADVAEIRHGKMERDGHHLHFNCCNKVLAIIVNESDDYSDIVSCPFCGAKMDGKGECE